MNDAEVMANAYAVYAQNLASFASSEKNGGILDQIQAFLKTNGATGLQVPASSSTVSTFAESLLASGKGMDAGGERDDGVRPACRFCGKTFAQASYIKAHERLHTGEKPYCCSVCNKAFSDASNWKKHERMHSRQIQSAVEDGIVPMVTSAPSTPEPSTPSSPLLMSAPSSTTGSAMSTQIQSFSAHLQHMTTSLANNNPMMPSLGNNPITPSLGNNNPMTSSLSNNQGSIAVSLASFFPEVSLSSSLSSRPPTDILHHSTNSQNSEDSLDLSPPAAKRARESADSLNCSLCGKLFSTPASLSMHRKIHSGEKPHVCTTCGKAFTQIGTLRAHERVHTGEKPYECTYCGKTFAQCGSFRMHERRHHRDMVENYQKCFVCGASFSSLEELQKHMMCHPGALSLNLQGLHPGALGFPGPLPLGFGIHPDLDNKCDVKPEVSEMKDIQKAFNMFSGQPKSAPAVSLSDHFPLPPFASTTHALIQRSLSQGSDPGTAVSMFLASNGASEGMSLLNQVYSASGLLSPAHMSQMSHMSRQDQPLALIHERPPRVEEVEPVTTTTRCRKYSSDSHTSQSLPDGPSDNPSNKSSDNQHCESKTQNGGKDEAATENEAGSRQNQKAPSEDSSLAESRSTEDFQSDDQQHGSAMISRKNLNCRLISSSNSRKQRRPMRRLNYNNNVDHILYQRQFNIAGEEIMDEEKLTKDQKLVSFLLSKGEVFKCEHCHIIFEDCTLYLLHNGFHANDTDPFKCVICKKSCDDRVEFNCHLTSHINNI